MSGTPPPGGTAATGGRMRMTRRSLLTGTSRLALVLAAGRLVPDAAARAGAWSDGTWFDDGSGWSD
ncbi:MAG TPA: hypothetical protein VFZ01_17860 [Geminicoccaceae bacterium]